MVDSQTFTHHYQQGLVYYAGGHYEQSLNCLKKVILLQPDFPDTYFLIIKIYQELGRDADAVSLYEKLLTLLPNDLEVRHAFGAILLKTGEKKKGIQVLKQNLHLNPKDPHSRLELAKHFSQENAWKNLLELAEAGIKTLPDHPTFHYLAGDALRKLRKYKKAQKYFESCLELDPEFEPAKRGFNAVIQAIEQGEVDEEEAADEIHKELMKAAELFSSENYDAAIVRLLSLKDQPGVSREASTLLGLAFARKGLYKRAKDVFLTLVDPQNPDLLILYNLGLASNRMGRYEEALDYLLEALNQDSEYEEALVETGVSCLFSKDHNAARNFFVRALKINRNNPRAYAYLALMAFDKKDKMKTGEFLQHAQETDPECPAIHLVRGYIAVRQGRWEEAEQQLKECLELSPDFFEAHKLLGWAQFKQEKRQEAAAAFQAAMALNPADLEVHRIWEETTDQLHS